MRGVPWLALAVLSTPWALAQTPAAEDLRSAVSACAALDAPADRLACYDRASGRNTPDSAPRAAAVVPAGTPPPPTRPAPSASAAPYRAPAGAATVVAAPPPAAAAAPGPTESFGLYAAEHPAPPPAAASLTGRVQALGLSSRGRPTVTLDNGGQWELDGSDPLLAVGDVVIIHRAAFNSFLLETPSRRQHRALRLQ